MDFPDDVGNVLNRAGRVVASGKHLSLNGLPFRAHGVTYGSFRRRTDGAPFPETELLRQDVRSFRRAGINTVRTYDLPPPDLIELTAEHSIQLVAGLSYHDWRMESSVGRSSRRRIIDAGRRAVDEALDLLADQPHVMAVAVGNEVPVDLVRLHGRRSVERTLIDLVERLHAGAPDVLATYVNYPSTEFLDIPNQDLVAFNVFLERSEDFRRYIDHLQVISGDRPLLISEVGLAGEIHGESAQAALLGDQLRSVDEAGLAGAFVFSWTDDWAVDDKPVRGWGFGITDAERCPKPALDVVNEWSTRPYPAGLRTTWPRLSVVVCAYNEEVTIAECVDSILASTYPDLEVIVCDDGSTDRTAAIVQDRSVKLLQLDHGGLSNARNAGLAEATGDVIAYLDADAACHPDWPYHLALAMEGPVAATGGPNLPVDDVGLVERAISHVPGQASEVLIGPDRAEHIPGCNMAFRRDQLIEIGGFDVRYTSAGDDVDVCWKLQDAGHAIGFSPAAQVSHHRRSSIRGFLRQQVGYGRAERMLAGPHRHRLNVLRQARWSGFVYGPFSFLPGLLRSTVYTGWLGSAPFQPAISHRARHYGDLVMATLPLIAVFGIAAIVIGLLFPPAVGVAAIAAAWLVVVAVISGVSARLEHRESERIRMRVLVGVLTTLQPLVRTWGRLKGRSLEGSDDLEVCWSGDRLSWVDALERQLHALGRRVTPGRVGDFWDLDVTDRGPVSARITTAIAWSWEPRYIVRCRINGRWMPAIGLLLLVAGVGGGRAWVIGAATVVGVALAVSYVRTRRSIDTALRQTTSVPLRRSG